MNKLIRNWPTVVAFGIMFAGLLFALAAIRVERDQRVDDVAKTVDQICESDADTRQRVIDAVRIQSHPIPQDPNADPATQARINKANDDRIKLRELMTDLFSPAACADGRPPDTRVPLPR